MKKLGMIGGLAWPSTITYYQTINEEIEKRTGHIPDMVIGQTDFYEILKKSRSRKLGCCRGYAWKCL